MSILVLTSDTLIGTAATGNIEYNGQFYGTDSNASRAQLQRITQGTLVATTSGTSVDYTGIPAWVKRVTVILRGVSMSGTADVLVQLGTSGGIVSTGYVGASSSILTTVATTAYTTGFGIRSGSSSVGAASIITGLMTIDNISTNTWVESFVGTFSATGTGTSGGDIALGAVLDRVRITTTNGTDTFDAGSVNLLYEG